MTLVRVISGGQTGADRAALMAARAAGIPTGGWMPRGFLAQDGRHPEFAARYGMREAPGDRYQARTALNVKESDGTVRFAAVWDSPGEVLTLDLCRRFGKPVLDIAVGGTVTPADAAAWVVARNIRTLNVAGNSERTAPGIEDYVFDFLDATFGILLLSAAGG